MSDFSDLDAPVSEGTRLLFQSLATEIVRLRKELAVLRAYARPEDIAAAERSLAPQEASDA